MDPIELFPVKLTQIKLAKRRGFDTKHEDGLHSMSTRQFKELYGNYAEDIKKSFREALSAIYESSDEGDNRRLYVAYAKYDRGSKQLGKPEMEIFTQIIEKYAITDAILITAIPLSSASKDIVNKLSGTKNIQIFNDKELKFDVTEHELVPIHRLLSLEEQMSFLQLNRAKLTQIPLIRQEDPVIKYYGWQPGRVVQIIRTIRYLDLAIPIEIFYRVIIPS